MTVVLAIGPSRVSARGANKRSFGEMKRLGTERDIVLPDLPDDVLVDVILRSVIETWREMEDLLAIRQCSTRFSRLIDSRVIPLVTRLSDSVLETIMEKRLERFTGLVEVTVGSGAARITGETLSLFPRLRTLRLNVNHRVTAQGLVQLTRLTALAWTHERGILDDTVLRALTKLERLDLGEGRAVTDAGLASLTNLTCLRAHALIGDRGVAPLSRLRTLIVAGGTRVTDATVSTLTNLTELVMSAGPITDRGISALTRLTRLAVYGNTTITDVGITALVNLRQLALPSNHVITGATFDRLTRLTELDLRRAAARIGDDAITRLVSLTSLNLLENVHFRGDTLHLLSSLRILNLAWNRGVRDQQLARLTMLTALDLNGNTVISSTSVASLTNLRTLVVRGTSITNAALIGLTCLTELDMRGNHDINNAALRHLPALRWLTSTDRVASDETRAAIVSRSGRVDETGDY